MSGSDPDGGLDELTAQQWDLVVIGGGIAGAGVLREATVRGLRAVLLEQNDFASGTSSRSSKLVHGGLRYLTQLDLRMVIEAARERDRLLANCRGLVEPLEFVVPVFRGDRLPPAAVVLGLATYDLLAHHRPHRRRPLADVTRHLGAPLRSGVRAAYAYFDAFATDAGLVMRVLREASEGGGRARNYTRVSGLLRDRTGRVVGVEACDRETGRGVEVRARAVVNATGAWADQLTGLLSRPRRLRLVRGAHLVLPRTRLPLAVALAAHHPHTGRALFGVPWGPSVIVGCTHVDHDQPVDRSPRATAAELDELLDGISELFPSLGLSEADVCSTYAGLRAITDPRDRDPSAASRRDAIWRDDGMVTVVGGKLTTFGSMARRVMDELRDLAPAARRRGGNGRPDPPVAAVAVDGHPTRALVARYGADAVTIMTGWRVDELRPMPGLPVSAAEVRWAARAEAVRHLDDLLLRRLGIGLMLPGGGAASLARLRPIVQPELGWDDARWETEADTYLAVWRRDHAPPGSHASAVG